MLRLVLIVHTITAALKKKTCSFEFLKQKNHCIAIAMTENKPQQNGPGPSGLVMNIAGGKKRAQPSAFSADDEEQDRKSQRADNIRDLEEGKDRGPKVIGMKEQTAWHKGRLGKGSNAEQLIRIHQMGGTASMELSAPQLQSSIKTEGEEDDSMLSVEERARRALVKEAKSTVQGVEGEEATLGLKIETGTASSRAVRTEEEAYKEVLSGIGANIANHLPLSLITA